MITLPITIQVKQEHIDNGVRHSCERCMIALAIQDEFKKYENFDHIGVGFNLVTCYHSNNEYDKVYEIPHRATNAINAFDRGCKVQPFSFVIEREY